MRAVPALFVFAIACGGSSDPGAADAPGPRLDAAAGDPDAPGADAPPSCSAEIQFTAATGCQNDGSVEFCIPDGNVELRNQLAAISSAITCATGGGQARCNTPAGRLLCFYPTQVPAECQSRHGAMTDEAWADMCAIAALPEVTAIVPTILE